MFGFRYRETLRGTYHLLSAPLDDLAMELTVEVKTKGIRSFLRDRMADIEGEITLENLAERKPLSGTLAFKLLDERRLPYSFSFTGEDGKIYRMRGQRALSIVAPAESITTLPATLYDAADREIGRGMVRFDVRGDGGKLLRSLRPRIAV
jgi:hypothetical protein